MRLNPRLLALGAAVCLGLTAPAAQAQDEGLPLPQTTKAGTTGKGGKKPHSSGSPVSGEVIPPASVPTTVTTGFDPKLDQENFPNPADFAEPNGECFGMSIVAIDNFQRRQAATAAGATPPAPKPLAHSAHDADAVEQAIVSHTQTEVSQKDDDDSGPVREVAVKNPSQINAALVRMAKTGTPEVMTISGREDGHATVLFGYKDGKLQIYDPNYPGKTIEWPFDPVKGLGKHPEGGDDSFYRTLKTAGVTPLDKLDVQKDLDALRASPATLEMVDGERYPTITSKTTPAANGNLTVTGTVSRGPTRTLDDERTAPPTKVWVLVNGKPLTFARIVDGSYKLTVPATSLTGDSNKIRLVATTGEGDFAGFHDAAPIGPRTGLSQAVTGATGGH